MPRKCSICQHHALEIINKMLVEGRPLSDIVSVFPGLTKSAIHRHRESHVPKALSKAKDAELEASGDSLLHQVQDLQARTMEILRNAENAKEHTVALRAICEARRNLELVAKMQGQLQAETRLVIESQEVQAIINQLVIVIKQEVDDPQLLQSIADRLQKLG